MVVSGSIMLEFTYFTFSNNIRLLFTTDETDVRNGFVATFRGKERTFFAKAQNIILVIVVIDRQVGACSTLPFLD